MTSGFDLDLGLSAPTHVLITGAAGHIGRVVVQAFLAAGSCISALDLRASDANVVHDRVNWIYGDITDESALENAFQAARDKFGIITTCITLAGIDQSYITKHNSSCDVPLDQWRRVIDVNITGTFLTARAWLRGIRDHATPSTRNISLILVGSTSGIWGVPTAASYATSKSAVQYGLLQSLAPDAVRINPNARVNAIAPGPVDTEQFRKDCAEEPGFKYLDCEATFIKKQAIPLEAVARVCLTLASDRYSGASTGQLIRIDNGKTGTLQWLPDGRPA